MSAVAELIDELSELLRYRSLQPDSTWTEKAANWPITFVSRETEPGHWTTNVVPAKPTGPLIQLHICCAVCRELPSVFCMEPKPGEPYTTIDADIRAGILAHIRRSHDS